MSNGLWVWFKRIDSPAESAVDLAKCDRYVVSTYGGNPYEDGVIYYLQRDGDQERWIKHCTYGYYDGTYEQDAEAYSECEPEEVAHDLVNIPKFRDRFPKNLEAHRGMGDRGEFFKWRRKQLEQSASSPLGMDPNKPIWLKEWVGGKEKGVLTYRGNTCKNFVRKAPSPWLLLDRFHDNFWGKVRNSFLPKDRKDTINNMNEWENSSIQFKSSPGGYITWTPL